MASSGFHECMGAPFPCVYVYSETRTNELAETKPNKSQKTNKSNENGD